MSLKIASRTVSSSSVKPEVSIRWRVDVDAEKARDVHCWRTGMERFDLVVCRRLCGRNSVEVEAEAMRERERAEEAKGLAIVQCA